MMKRLVIAGVVGACWLMTEPVAAQQRPLVTEDPETIGAGLILLEGGFDLGRDESFPVSGLTGNTLRMPVGVSIGLSSIAELQIDGGFFKRLSVTDREAAPLSDVLDFEGDSTSDIEDVVIATKVRVLAEAGRRPAFGVRFATRLPNAGNESGLGLDTTDFLATMLVGKTVESVRVVGNVGLGILADPTRGDRQNDVLLYGLSMARAIATGLEVVAEVNGRAATRSGEPPPGTESRARLLFGSRYTRGPLRVDAALRFGATSPDADFGFTMGFTYVFRAFNVP